jgi:hypothetical protein
VASSAVASVVCVLIALTALKAPEPAASDETIRHVGLVVLLLLATPVVGLPVATMVFAAILLRRAGIGLFSAVAAALVLTVVEVVLLETVFDVLVEREIIGRIAWLLLGY